MNIQYWFKGLLKVFFCIVLLSGCATENVIELPKPNENTSNSAHSEGVVTSDKVNVTLYFPTKDAMYLKPVQVDLPKEQEWLKSAVKLLGSKPDDADLTAAFPNGELVNSIRIEGVKAVVDLNLAEISKLPRGTTTENIVIQSIVHTLTQNTDVTEVLFTIDGKKKDTLLGHLDILDPVLPESDMIQK